jgi:cell division protein FtsL
VRASESFRLVIFCLVVLALAGVARVSLAAKAAEATVDAWELRADVKAERLAGRTLEADKSALAAPSRIEAVASQTLNMSRPAQVSYLQLPSTEAVPVEQKEGGSGKPALLATLVDLAAGEAQVMLVGDVGLGSLQ